MRLKTRDAYQPSLLELLEEAEYQEWIKKYRTSFARDHSGPYAIQWPGHNWKTRYKEVSDPLLKAHLNEKYWVAVKASWYPTVYFLDFDAPTPAEIDRIVDALQLRRGQYLLMTSPSYIKDGSCHLALRPEYQGKLPTHRLGYEALRNMVGRSCEIYPQLKRKFRLPLGRGQRLIGEDGQIFESMPWWEAMYWIDKIDPISIEQMRFQMELPFASLAKKEDRARRWVKTEQVRELYQHGLQAKGTRHESQWVIAVSLWRANWLPQDAMATLKKWIRRNHNGFSETINKGNWRAVEAEIGRQVQWIWQQFRPYPDSPHNLEGYLTRGDLSWIAEVYPGDVVNQKRLCALVCYIRPRAHHDFVYVPARIWRDEVANVRTYHEFIADLENKGLLDAVMSYRHVAGDGDASYSRKFRLHLPASNRQPIIRDERNVQDYYEALRLEFGAVREIADLTRVRRDIFYEAFERMDEEDNHLIIPPT